MIIFKSSTKDIFQNNNCATNKPNDIIEHNNYFEIKLTNYKNKVVAIALADNNLKDIILKYRWCLNANGYPCARYVNDKGIRRTILLHNIVMGYTGSQKIVIDHINRNKLDNRKSNLRRVSNKVNGLNTNWNNKYGCAGVSYVKSRHKFQVAICGKYIGQYDTIEEAIKVRKDKEIEYYGKLL